MTHPTQEDDVKAIRVALAEFHQWMDREYPDRLDRQGKFRMSSVQSLMEASWLAAAGAQAVRLDAAVLAEREACAKVCEDRVEYDLRFDHVEGSYSANVCAQRIRQRAAIASEAKT